MQIRRLSESLRRLADCSQPVLLRREYFHVSRLFNALQAGKFSHAVFRAPRASMAMPRAHANSAASERPSALSVGCSQPVFGRREHFHVLCLFNGLQAGKFPLPSFEGAARVDRDRAGACKILRRAKSLHALVWLLPARPRPSREFPRFAPFQCVAGRKISRPLFGAETRDAPCGGRRARQGPRAQPFSRVRAVAVDGAAGRRSPVLVGNARRAFTHRPPLRQGDAVRRLSAEADADRVASKRKGMNKILRPNLDEGVQ